MPQLIALGLVGALGWYAWRALKRQMEQVANENREKEETRNPRDIAALEKGEDGVYRPKSGDRAGKD